MLALKVERKLILENLKNIREAAGVPVIGVLKAGGYGLGAVELGKTLLSGGVRTLAVSRLPEAKALREAGIDCEILLLSPTAIAEEARQIVELSLTGSVGSIESANVLNAAARDQGQKAKVHIKVDTGYGRYGFLPGETDLILKALSSCEYLEPVGLFSHLQNAFGKNEKETRRQYDLFCSVLDKLRDQGLTLTCHIANSCAALRWPWCRLDAVRIGSALTGRLAVKTPVKLSPVGRLTVQLDEVRWLPAGHNIGYGGGYRTRQPMKAAVLPVGWADGFDTEKSRDIYTFGYLCRYTLQSVRRFFRNNNTYCCIGGKRARIVGRVGLTHCVADVTELDCRPGDEVVLTVNPILVNASVPRIYEE